MPTKLQKLLNGFANDLKYQLTSVKNRGFLPREFHACLSNSGSSNIALNVKNRNDSRSFFAFQPDSLVGFLDQVPFLVLEVSVSQNEDELFIKADRYIKGSKGRIVYVLLVVVERSKDNATDDAETPVEEAGDTQLPSRPIKAHPALQRLPSEASYEADGFGLDGSVGTVTSPNGAGSASDDGEEHRGIFFSHAEDTLKDGDMIFIHLFQSAVDPETRKRITRRVLQKTKVFPTTDVEQLPTFTISLSDISSLEVETEPAEISFLWLTDKGEALLDHDGVGRLLALLSDDEDEDPPTNRIKF